MISQGETNLFVYCGNNPVMNIDDNGMFWKQLLTGVKNTIRNISRKISRSANLFFRSKGFNTAAAGAYFLQMYKDKRGIYHATFDCWQQYFGYNNLYDFVFDVFTQMKSKKFKFSYNGKQYVLWAWKGDYLNLGAGAEIGIYYGGEPHWRVDKKLAMKMTMSVIYKGKRIIYYAKNTWWLTGFNPKYLCADVSKLKVTYRVIFNSKEMYNAFKKYHKKTWTFNDKGKSATYTF